MILGYARVSTTRQADNGTSLDTQREQLTAAGAERIFTEAGVSGAKTTRPQLDRMLEQLRPGDTVVVTKLDRLGRSLSHLVALVEQLRADGIGLRSVAEGIDTNTEAGRLVFGIFASLAEFERERIRERTTVGREAARAQGKTGGRPRKYDAEKIRRAHELHTSTTTMSPKEKAAALGVSLSSFYRLLQMDPNETTDN